MTTLLAFDTVFEQCSLAIIQDEQVIYEQTIAGGRGQTEIILGMVDKALTSTQLDLRQLDGLAFNRGPGAFSGIRINTAVVQALAVAADLPCVGVSSLAVLAHCAYQQGNFADGKRIVAVIDARQNQVYAGQFISQDGNLHPYISATPAIPDNADTPDKQDGTFYGNELLLDYDSRLVCDVVVGDGAALVQTAGAIKWQAHPTAIDIAQLGRAMLMAGQAVSAKHALPVYLRHHAWKTLAEQGRI